MSPWAVVLGLCVTVGACGGGGFDPVDAPVADGAVDAPDADGRVETAGDAPLDAPAPQCPVPPATVAQPPYTVTLALRNTGTEPLYLRQGCVGMEYRVGSCAAGYGDQLEPRFTCGCSCADTSCSGNPACGACPPDVGLLVRPGESREVVWRAERVSEEQKAGTGPGGAFTCYRRTPLPAGRYRVTVSVYTTATAALERRDVRETVREFDLPVVGDRLSIDLSLPSAVGDAGTSDNNLGGLPLDDGGTPRVPCADAGSECLAAHEVLTGLEVEGGTLTPAFRSDVLAYTMRVNRDAASVKVRPSVRDPSFTSVRVNGNVPEGSPATTTVATPYGTTAIDILVFFQARERHYTIRVERGDGAVVRAPNAAADDRAGAALAAAGDVLVVGAPGRAMNAGAVFIYRRAGGAWTREAELAASNAAANDAFGTSVAVNTTGDLVAIGAPFESSDATGVGGDQTNDRAQGSGAVYVFRRVAGVWTQEAYAKASNAGWGDMFGNVVALSGDRLAVAAPGERNAASGINGDQAGRQHKYAGAVYVLRRDAAGWVQEAYVKSAAPREDERFGQRIGLSGDRLVAGDGAGRAFAAFARGTEGWKPDGRIMDSASAVGPEYALALEGDTLALGGSGSVSAVVIYSRTAAGWAFHDLAKHYPLVSGASTNLAGFGQAIALRGDWLAVGAPREASGGSPYAPPEASGGVAHVYRRPAAGMRFVHVLSIVAPEPGAGDLLGATVALGDGFVAAGAPAEDGVGDALINSGAAFPVTLP